VANNYPPVSFYVVGAFGSAIGDNIVAGRLVALFGFVVTAVLVGMVTRRVSGSPYAGAVSALLFAGYAASLHAGYIGMNDPQWLAHAIMSVALLLMVARPDPTHRPWLLMLVTAALLAGLTKHNLLALPVAITLWLLIYDRRSLWVWISFSMFLLAGASGVLYAAYGPEFFQGVFGFQRGYTPYDIEPKLLPWAFPLIPLVGALVCFVLIEPPSRDKTLLLLYVIVASAWGAYALGGAGVNMNVMYDALIGLAIIAGIVVHRVSERFRGVCAPALAESVAAVLLAAGMLAAVPRQLLALPSALANLHAQERRIASDVEFIASITGPVACESLALCYWAGKPYEFDMFAVGQQLRAGVLREDDFERLMGAHYFKAIQLDDQGSTMRLPKAAMDSIHKHYVRSTAGADRIFLVPRASAPGEQPS
jgi:hypothetical protein